MATDGSNCKMWDTSKLNITLFLLVAALNVSQAEWSEWGSYGNCSRPCGGGLANKTRTCLGASHTCQGIDIRYKLCNQQNCAGAGNEPLRAVQCRSYDQVAIADNYYHWVPHPSPDRPCALYCRTVETDFVLKMQDEVWNGTACGKHGNGVCIQGRCKRVGCNGVIGSRKSLDVCGVCGGDGSSCIAELGDQPDNHPSRSDNHDRKYKWDVQWSACSQSCGAGVQSSRVRCVTMDAEHEVDEGFCPPGDRPRAQDSRSCADVKSCEYRWHAFKWGSCSRTCGSGHMYRRVICLKHDTTAHRKRVHERKCMDTKPDIQAQCNTGDCPEWLTGPWTKCSVPCGYGTQKRKIVCKTSTSAYCTEQSRPTTVQRCYSGKSCSETGLQQDDTLVDTYDFYDDAKLRELLLFPKFLVTHYGPCTVTCGVGYKYRNVTCVRGEKIVPLSQCTGDEPHNKMECHQPSCPLTDSSESAYGWRHGSFGPCSQSCGRGIQTSVLQCTDVSNNKPALDVMCNDVVKPEPISQYCNAIACPPSWKVGDYSSCTVPCGGGRQSRDVSCVERTAYGGEQAVAEHRCPDPIPLSERSCNVQFCQAEWSTDAWGECSVTCGLGVETRAVFCVKYVSTSVKVNVSTAECIGPRPETTRQCHFGDCYKLNHLPVIKEQKGTYLQIKRTKRVGLIIGETAVLLPNQAVKIKCPVKNFQRKHLFWTKNHRLVRLIGRVRVSSNGALRIARANPALDSGTFTCSAGMLHATINITFHSKKEAKRQANQILNDIFQENLNESFINRPQRDEMLKMTKSKQFHVNSISFNNGYDYSSFTTSNWTQCSTKCGLGTQARIVTCNHVTDEFIRLLPEEECVKKGLKKPSSLQKCIVQKECPKWKVGNWSLCSALLCHEDGFALQRRSVHCVYSNGSTADDSSCDMAERPAESQKCPNASCTSVWHTSAWSECTPRCGVKGKKVRALSCVWATTKKPAFDNCQYKPRPRVSKTCKPKPCHSLEPCTDASSYCRLAGRLKMCRYSRFRRRCCRTCTLANL